MTLPLHGSASTKTLRTLAAAQRIAAIADPGSARPVSPELEAPRPSPHLVRWGITAQDDDGVVVARATIDGAKALIAAQDERFLGGSAGANHSDALHRLFRTAAAERPAAVVLLAASGGVRLHEANAAEWKLARALSALLDLRAAGVPVLVVGVADVFGGVSVLACAAERIALLAGARLGLSGPAVIETARGKDELDARDEKAVAAVFGAEARAAAAHVELLRDDANAVRHWIGGCLRQSIPFEASVHAKHEKLGKRLLATAGGRDPSARADSMPTSAPRLPPLPANLALLFATVTPVDDAGWLARGDDGRGPWLCRPVGAAMLGPQMSYALDDALVDHVLPAAASGAQALVLLGDSRGHEVSVRSEALCMSQYLAHHAAVLALLRSRSVRVRGLLTGVGHSAEFFANVLQATELLALPDARVVAMEPAAVARVTRLPQGELLTLIENDPLLGQPVRHFAGFAGMGIVADGDLVGRGLLPAAGRSPLQAG